MEAVEVRLTRLSSLSRGYLRALWTRKPAAPGPIPTIVATLDELRFDAAALARYRTLFGLASAATLPLLYPQVATAAAFAELILDPAVPLRPLGLVHRRSTVTAVAPLPGAATYGARFRIQVARDTDRGLELDFVTELALARAPIWSGTTTVLLPRRGEATARRSTQPPVAALEGPGLRVERWELPASLGRRYAAVSGDYNPIHLSRLTAWLFGYRRPIAHGLWTLGRALAMIDQSGVGTLEAAFKRPLFLPARVVCWARPEGDALLFGVRDDATGVPHLLARLLPGTVTTSTGAAACAAVSG